MKIKLQETPQQIELIQALGSKKPSVSAEAAEALAAFVSEVIGEVILQAATAGLIYTDLPFDEDSDPSIPLDLYFDESVGHITVWSQNIAGGLPSSQVVGMQELKFSLYRLDSAVSFLKKYARKSRLDVVSKAIERMAQEVLVKQERNAWAVVLQALADAAQNTTSHVITSNTESLFVLADLSSLITRMRRINQSFADGTPADMSSRGLTDLFVSPEIKEQIRSFAFNPINTVDPDNTAPTGPGHVLDDVTRREIFTSAGAQELYGINIMDMPELGTTQKYNDLFDDLAGAQTIAHSASTFVSADDEILVGFDLTREAFLRPIERNEDGNTFTALPDDQFVSRSDKQGFYGFLSEGRLVTDARSLGGIVV